MTVPNRERIALRPFAQASAPAKPATQRQTILKLVAISLVTGLMLVSLDITPRNIWLLLQDFVPFLEGLGHTIWRAGEVLLGCLAVGALIVLPIWYFQRRRKAQLEKSIKRTQPNVLKQTPNKSH